MAGVSQVPAKRYWRVPLDHDKIERPHGNIHILAERCKGCSYCVEYCPLDVLRMSTRFNLKGYHSPEVALDSTCVACHLCEVICPEFAIFVTEEHGSSDYVDPSEARKVKKTEEEGE